MDLKKLGFGLLKEIGAIGWGTAAGTFKLFWNTLEGASKQLMQFHEEGIAFARDVGMSLNQAQAYTKVLTKNTKELAWQYGVTSETIMKIQKGLSEATSKQLFLNQSQTEHFLQLNKLAGESSVSKFAEEMMNGMGAQIDAVEGAVAKAYATATKSGLSAKKTTEIIANSLSIANKLSFRNGVDGLTKMAMQAQKIGMSLQSVESVARTFMDFEGSIEHAAQLQMLGGAAGAFGGNPLDMMYEANYDPEALQNRMAKMLGGYAQFNAKTGMSTMNGMAMDFVRNIAKAMGMDEGEAVRVAKKNAELKYKEQHFGGRFANYTQEQQDLIMNRSYVKEGRLYINDAGGKEHDITNGLDKDILDELHKWDGKSDREIMEIQAKTLTTINERIEGLISTIKAVFAEKFADYVPKIQEWIEKNGGKLVEKTMAAANWIVKEGPNFVKKITDYAKNIWEGAKEGWGYIKKYFPWFLTALAAFGISRFGKGGFGRGGKAPAGAAAKSGGTSPNGGTPSGGSGASPKSNIIRKTVDKRGNTRYYEVGKNGKVTSRLENSVAEQRLKNGAIQESIGKNGRMVYHKGGKFANSADIEAAKNSATNSGGWFSKAKGAFGKAGKVAKIGGKFAKVGGLAAVLGGLQAYFAKGEYDEAERQVMTDESLSKEDKKQALEEIKKRRNEAYGSAAGAAILGTAGAFIPGFNFIGAVGGGMLGDWIGSKIGGAVTGEVDDEEYDELLKKYNGAKPKQSFGKGGVVLGDKVGAPVDVEAHVGEGVITPDQFKLLFETMDRIAKAVPVGKNDFTYVPGKTEVSKVGNCTVTVKDFNINLGGTLRLDGGNNFANINVNELLRDPQFVGNLKDVISDAISASYNGGKKMNDIATVRGMVSQTTTWGKG